MGPGPGLGNDAILCPSYKLPKSKKKVCWFGKTLDIYRYLLFLCELLIGSCDLGHTGLQHLLQGHLGQGMASNPINFLAQAKQEGLYIPGRLKDKNTLLSALSKPHAVLT